MDKVSLPQQAATGGIGIIGIEGKYAIVLGGNVSHIAGSPPRNKNPQQVERVGVGKPIDGIRKQLPEACRIDAAQAETRLAQVLASAGFVVMVGGHIDTGPLRICGVPAWK